MKIKILFIAFCFLYFTSAYATTYYNKASGTGALQTPSNWGTATDGTGTAPGGFTTGGDIFNLYNGTTGTISAAWVITGVTLNVGNGSAAMNLTIPSTFSLTGTGTVAVSAGATLTLQNTTNPTLGVLNATSTVDYNGTGAQTIAVATYGNLSLSGARSGTPAITLASGTIKVAGNFSVTYTGAVTFTTTGNTFNYSTLTGGSTVGGITYNILTFSNTSGTNTAGGNITAGGTMTTTAGGTLDMGATSILAVTGAITNNGTIKTSVPTSVSSLPIPAAKSLKGTVIYGALTGAQTIVSETYYTNLTLNNTSGTNTAGGAIVIRGGGGITTTAGGTTDFTASYRLTKSGGGAAPTVTNNGTIQTEVLTSTSTTPFISGLTWNGTGTVLYNAFTGTQTIMAGTYNCNLTLGNSSGTNIASGVITINSTLTTTSAGILNMSTFALAGTGTFVNNGTISTNSTTNPALPSGKTWTGTTGNVIFAATAGAQFVPAGTYGTLKFSNTSGTNTVNGAITVTTSLITTSGGTVAMGTNQLQGAFTPANNGKITTTCTVNPAIPSGDSWNGTTGAVTFAATTGGQFVPAGTYKTLTFSNTSGTNTAVGNITVNTGTLTTTAGGTMDMGASNILSGTATFTNNGTIQTEVPTSGSTTPIPAGLTWAGTITYGATTGDQTVVNGTYNNLNCNNTSGTNTAGGNITVNGGTMTTTAGGILDMGTTSILSGTGTFTNNGSIKTSVPTTISATPIPSGKAWGGTIIYGALSGAQTIESETSFNNLTFNNTSGTNSAAANMVVNGALTTTTGGTLDMSSFTLSGSLSSISGGGTIQTSVPTATSATPITSGKTWTQIINYYNATGAQTIVSGTYTGGLTNSNTSGTNTVVTAGTVSIPGNLTLSSGSALNDNGVIISLSGNIAGTGSHTGTGAISMTGSGATISGVTLGNLTLNNAGGFSLTGGNLTINGTLTLTAGRLDIGANAIIFGASAPAVAGTLSSSNMIIANGGGQIQKQFSGTGPFLFPAGDNTPLYSPITLNFTGGTFGGGAYAGVKVTNAKHPQNANTANYLNRYWSIATSGITSPVYQVTAATYAASDVTGTEGNLVSGAYPAALPWIKVSGSSVNTSTHTLSATGSLTNTSADITGINTFSPTVTITSPTTGMCSGSTAVLTANPTGDPSFSYSWVPSTGLSATTGTTVNAAPTATGTVSAVYVYTVTATDGNGFTATGTYTLTVNPVPVISGTATVCFGSTTTLSSNISGVWSSSNSSVASAGSSTGIVNGAALGTANITITPGTGCISTIPVTVNAVPSAITGPTDVCAGSIIALTESVSGGTWSSSDITIGTVDASGNVTGIASGSVTISYTSGASCYVTQPMTVGPLLPITGTFTACVGLTTTLSDASTGGTWTSGSTSVATVGSSSGIVTGVSPGTSMITYTLVSGCFRTVTVTINAVPSAITGTQNVCTGLSTTLGESASGGAWSSGNTAIATIGTSGIVSGVTNGTAAISYISGPGCYVTAVVTVNPLPASITGTLSVCAGSTTTLSDATGSGTWSSSNANATVGTSGTVTGVSAGNSTITYTLPTSCVNTAQVTINALPAAITGTMNVCAGLNTTLNDATGGGSWSSSNTSLATIGSGTGIVNGIAAGTPTISYTLAATGCTSTTLVTVNALPSSITGTFNVCVGSATTLSDAGGGTWSSSNGNATIGSSTGTVNGVTAGTAVITYTLPTGCINTTTETINPLPGSITGTAVVCAGQTTTLGDGTSGGTWTSSSAGLATVGSASGVVTGVAAGNPTITYSLSTGCQGTTVATVNPLPAAIVGSLTICNGSTETFTDATVGGTWSSSDVTNATIGSSSGIITTVSSGPATISYQLTTGCTATNVLTVNDVPSSIGGTTEICNGLSTTLTDPDGGGSWASGDNTIATIGSSSGIVNSVAAGTATISYTFTSTGCYTVAGMVIDPLPSGITGTLNVCVGSSTDLNDATTGGDWSNSNNTVGTIDAVTGILTALTTGTTTVTYTLSTGCTATSVVTVSAMPTLASATNGGPICAGGTLTLTANTPANVTSYAWSGPVSITSSASASASVPAATLAAAGTFSVTVTNGSGIGCANTYTTTATVNTTPTAGPTNSGPVCNTGTVTLTANPGGSTTNYIWSGSSLSSTTVANPTATPTATATYSLTVTNGTGGSGCSSSYTTTVSVNATPTAAPTNSGPICNSGTVTLTANPAGSTNTYSWSGSNLASTTVANPTATPTATATYSLTVTNGTGGSGCSSSYTTTVSVNATPTAAPVNNGPICNSGQVTLTPNPGGSTNTYIWSGSNLASTTTANTSAVPTTTATYSLTVTDGTANSGCSSSYTTTVSVNATPTATPINSGPICNTGTVTLTANPGGSTNTYTWTGSNLSATTIANPTATPTATATYSLTVTNGTAASGCSSNYTTTVSVNATPTAAPVNSGPICNSGSATLTANPGGSTNTYLWSGSNLSSTTVANPAATPTATSTYSLTVTNGTGGSGCSSSYTSTVLVNPTPTAGPTNNGPICSIGSVMLTSNPGGSTSTYTWSGPGLSSTSVANPTATPTATTTYSLTVTNGTANSGCSTSYTTTVSVNATPSAAPANSGPICNSGLVTLTANPGGSANTYAWSGPNLSSSTVANPTATPTSTATYTLTVTNGTANPGCSSTYTTTVSVNATPTAAPVNNGPICNGGNVAFTANPGGSTNTYSWSGSNLLSTTSQNPQATPTATATYTLTVTNGTGGSGCSSGYTTTVSVNATPTAAPANSGPICNIGTVTLTANPAGSTNTYTWSGSNLSSTTVANPTATPSATATYTLTVTNGTASSGCTNSYTTTVTVTPSVTAVPSNDGPICNGGTVNLNANPGGGASVYLWSGPNISSSTISNPTATPTATVTYSVTVSDGTSNPGCVLNLTTSVSVNPTPSASPTSSGPICLGNTVSLSSDPTGGVTTYSWSGPYLSSSAVPNPTAAPTVTSTYSLTVSSGSASGCSPATIYTVTVAVNSLPAIISISNNGPVCTGNTLILSNTTAGGSGTYNYSWSGPSSFSSTLQNASIVSATTASSGTYSLTVTDGNGCNATGTNTTTAAVNAYSAPSITMIGNNSAICSGNTLNLTSTVTGGTGALTYAWAGPSSFSSSLHNPSITSATTSASGVYSLTVTDANSCTAAGTSTTSVTVNPSPVVSPVSGPSGVCTGSTVTLTDATGGGLWASGSAVAAIGSSTGIVSGVAIGNVIITYTVTNSYACSTPVYYPFTVEGAPLFLYTASGNGTGSSTGDGGMASLATVYGPRAMAADNSGNIYISDVTVNRIRKISADGLIITVAGNGLTGNTGDGGPATAAKLNMAGGSGIYVDNSGNILIASTTGQTIRKVNASTGIITTIAGNPLISGYSGDGGPATAAWLFNPVGICEDGSGNIYFADCQNFRIRRIDAGTGIISTIAGTGSNAYSGDGGPGTAARLSIPNDVVADRYGNLYIGDRGNNVVRKYVIATGIITTFAGTGVVGSSGDGGPASAAKLNNPGRLAFDGGNNLIISDQNNNKIRQVDLSTGIISTVIATGSAGFSGDGGAATAAKLNGPCGIAVNTNGNIYVADANNRRIRVSPYNSSIMIIASGTYVPTGTPVTFTANTSLVSNISYQWKVNGTNVSGATNNTYTDYSVVTGNIYSCVITFSPDCSVGYSVTSNSITVITYGPPPFTSGIIAPAIANGLEFYPNPVHSILTVSGTGFSDGSATINVFDQLSRTVMTKSTLIADGKVNEQLDMKSLPPGLYILYLTDSESKTGKLKCIKN